MIYVTIIGHGPNWIPHTSVYDQDRTVIQAHLESMQHRYDEGTLLLGGPFDHAGGIAIWQAEDRDHARQMIEVDPAVVADLMSYELYELTAYFDRFTRRSASGDSCAHEEVHPTVQMRAAPSAAIVASTSQNR